MTGRQGRWAWGLVLPAVGLDRWMKALAGSWVEPVPLWPGILALHRVENRGMAFGLLAGRPVLLALLSLLVLGAGCWGLSRCRLGLLTRLGSALLLAGAVSNLCDRVTVGFVTDMLELLFVRFAIFNVADCWVCLGAGLLMLSLWLRPEEWERKRDAKAV